MVRTPEQFLSGLFRQESSSWTRKPLGRVFIFLASKLVLKTVCSMTSLSSGGGLTGLTAAYLLKKSGKKVCLLERDRLTAGDTGCTTAHLTYVTDSRLSELVAHFGRDAARLVWHGGAAAINTIESITETEDIACDFHRIPGFLHAPLMGETKDTEELQAECRLARELGFAATFRSSCPIVEKPGVAFANQAKFHPLKYLAGIARLVEGDGCAIFEQSAASEVESDPLAVKKSMTNALSAITSLSPPTCRSWENRISVSRLEAVSDEAGFVFVVCDRRQGGRRFSP